MDRDITVTTGSEPRPRLYRVGTIAGAVLGAVLLVAVWGKALDPAAFAEQIRGEGLDFLLSAPSMEIGRAHVLTPVTQ